jgi:hypothetical protein
MKDENLNFGIGIFSAANLSMIFVSGDTDQTEPVSVGAGENGGNALFRAEPGLLIKPLIRCLRQM